jgi:predicted RND superfamily exporter protein
MSEDANEVRRMAKAILPPEYEVRVTGEMLVLHQFADQVTHQLVQGLLLLSTSLAVIFLVVFRSLRLMVVGILANAFPLVVTLGCMGWADIPLSLGTFSVAIVALGMSVDDTIHFMVRFSDEKRRGRVTRDAVSNAFCKEIRPVLATTVAVSVGSLVMCLSSLFINQEGAILYAVAFMSALVADIFLLPCLLSFLGSPSSLLDGFNRLRKAWCPRR